MNTTTRTPTASQSPTMIEAPFSTALMEIADHRADVVVLAADLSKYTDVNAFAAGHTDRFIQIGMAEQNLMGVAAGLAKTGLVPIITTYCVFATRRSYEQVALALCTARRPMVIAAFLPGITTPFSATHQGTDDLALMRSIPGLTVIDPMDATELAAALKAAVDLDRPVYLRGLRGRVRQHLDPATYRFEVGQVHLLRDGHELGIISTGLGTEWALEAEEALRAEGLQASVLHVPTIKPMNAEAVLAFSDRFSTVYTVENHARIGGLGTAVAEVLAEGGARTRLRRLGVPDAWAPAGSLDFIRSQLGLDATGIAETITADLSGVSTGSRT